MEKFLVTLIMFSSIRSYNGEDGSGQAFTVNPVLEKNNAQPNQKMHNMYNNYKAIEEDIPLLLLGVRGTDRLRDFIVLPRGPLRGKDRDVF